MIPPSSLARLVLGYLEEEGLQRTAETFQEECGDAKKDPLTQYSSLKTILEEYVEIKDTASNPNNDPAKVLQSLWKKLDVIVGQLKYHTLPESKIPRVKQRTIRRSNYGNIQISKPASSHPNTSTNTNHNKNPSQNNQELVSTDTGSPRVPFTPTAANVDLTLSVTSRTNPGLVVSGVSLDQQQPGNLILSCKAHGTDTSGHSVPTSQPLLGRSGYQKTSQLQNTSSSTYSNDFRQDSFSSNHHATLTTATPNSSSGSLVCTCPDNYDSQTHAATPNSDCAEIPMIEVVDDGSTSAVTSNDTLIQEGSAISGHYSMENGSNKIEILSKSPKRKGHPPKKRNFNNPSPLKQVPVIPDPSTAVDDNFDLQQLLDGGNLDIDAAMPLLLDTFLSTPLLQEKLAENINKVVGSSSKQNEAATEVLSESSQMPPSKVDDTASNQLDEPQVPVDDILNLMEADPAFDALFSLLSTDAVKTASPAKGSQAVPTCSYSEPVSSGSVTHTACSSAEPVSTWSTTSTMHPSSFNNNISATSVVTESLLLLASSPSKCPTSLSTTSSLDNLHPISPKEVTPEFVHKQHKDGGLDTGLGGPGHVRSLRFLDQQPAKAPIGKPKKSKPPRQKRNASKTTSNKTGRQRIKKLNSRSKDSQASELLHGSSAGNIPGAAVGEPGTLSTIDLSAVKRLQSFASLHSNASGNNGNGTGVKKSQGSSLVQLLQDAAIHQQVQGVSTVNQKQNGASQSSTRKGLVPRSLQSLAPTTTLSSTSLNVMNISRQSLPPMPIAPAPTVNKQSGRTLLPKPSIQSQVYSMLLPAPPTSSSIQPVATCLSSSSVSFTSSLSSAIISPSVTVAPGMLPSLSSSSSFYQLLTMPSSVTSCLPLPQSLSSHLSSSIPSSYLQTPPPPPQSLSHVPQSSSTSTPSYIQPQPPPPQSSLSSHLSSSSTPSSYLQTPPPPQSWSHVTQPSSSTSTPSYIIQPPPPPQSSLSSHLSSSSTPSSYLQTPPSPQSLSHVTQPSSTSTSTPSYLQPPPLPQPSSSHLPQSSSSTTSSSSYALHSSSSQPLSSSYLQSLPPPPPSSSVPQSSLPSSSSSALSSSYLQSLPPTPPTSSCVSQSSLPSSSSHDSSLSMSVNQLNSFSSGQQHSYHDSSQTTYITLQSNLGYSPFTKLQRTASDNQKTNINSQGITALEKSPSPVAMATLEPQGPYLSPRLDSNEPSPTAQNAEECVSGFISGFEGGFSCGRSNNQEGSAIPMNSTLSSVSLDKDKDGTRLPKNGTNRKENAYGNEQKSKNDPSGIQCENVNKQENKRKETVMNIGGRGAEERRHGQKRPAGQDLKENKPKKSKECKKLKKSKSKSLPKNFDVDKFLSKLHYVEN